MDLWAEIIQVIEGTNAFDTTLPARNDMLCNVFIQI